MCGVSTARPSCGVRWACLLSSFEVSSQFDLDAEVDEFRRRDAFGHAVLLPAMTRRHLHELQGRLVGRHRRAS